MINYVFFNYKIVFCWLYLYLRQKKKNRFSIFFNKRNIIKILVIFTIGFSSRIFINDFFNINVFVDYLSFISIAYYFIMACFVVFIHHLVDYFDFSNFFDIFSVDFIKSIFRQIISRFKSEIKKYLFNDNKSDSFIFYNLDSPKDLPTNLNNSNDLPSNNLPNDYLSNQKINTLSKLNSNKDDNLNLFNKFKFKFKEFNLKIHNKFDEKMYKLRLHKKTLEWFINRRKR